MHTPIAFSLPGIAGFLFKGGKVVLSTSSKGRDVFSLVEKHGVTHIHVVPALLIGWINDPEIGKFDLSSLKMIQSGGQRLQPQVRLKTKELDTLRVCPRKFLVCQKGNNVCTERGS